MHIAKSRPDYAMDNAQRGYANSSRGWTGGDGGQSVPLPGGRVVWLYDDSYLGKVSGETRTGTPMIHNMIVVQQGTSRTTLYQIRHQQPKAYMEYGLIPGSRSFYWNNDGIAAGGALWISYSLYHYPLKRTVFNFRRTGTVLARLSLQTLQIERVSSLDNAARIVWGVWMMDHGPYVYIYGTGPMSGPTAANKLYLARAPRADLRRNWQYWDGSAWSARSAAAKSISDVVAPELSVTKVGNVYVLVTMGTAYGSDRLMAWFSCRPMGPFVNGKLVWKTIGGTGVYGTRGIPGVYTYGATAHPELTEGDQLVISYDVNTSDWALLNENVNIVRPRFIRATIGFPTA